MSRSYDKKKVQEIILFLIRSLGGNVELSRLFLLLYKADMLYLTRHGSSITGDTYVAMNYGPAPFHTHGMLLQAQKAVSKKTDKIKIRVTGNTKDIIAVASYNSAFLADSEVECIFEVIRKYKNILFEELSQITKDEAWMSAGNGEINIIEMARVGNASPKMMAYVKAKYGDGFLVAGENRTGKVSLRQITSRKPAMAFGHPI